MKTLLIFAVLIVLIGLISPWLQKRGLGRLPGDISWERNGKRYHLPITSTLLMSLLLTLLMRLFGK